MSIEILVGNRAYTTLLLFKDVWLHGCKLGCLDPIWNIYNTACQRGCRLFCQHQACASLKPHEHACIMVPKGSMEALNRKPLSLSDDVWHTFQSGLWQGHCGWGCQLVMIRAKRMFLQRSVWCIGKHGVKIDPLLSHHARTISSVKYCTFSNNNIEVNESTVRGVFK